MSIKVFIKILKVKIKINLTEGFWISHFENNTRLLILKGLEDESEN